MNRRLLSVGVFLTLMLTSLLAGHHNYCTARNEITADLNQALAQTLKENRDYIITQDTIKTYKHLRQTSGGQVLIAVSDERFCHHLKNKRLQKTAFITFDVVDNRYRNQLPDEHVICSDTLMVRDKHAGEILALKGYARLSAANVFGMSDQRTAYSGCLHDFCFSLGDAVVALSEKETGRAGSCCRLRGTGLFRSGPAVLYSGTHSYPLYSHATATHAAILECTVTFID